MSHLFTPTRIGRLQLPNRAVMAPMTRSRASSQGIQTPLAATYYTQRARAGLIVTEAIAVSRQGHGYPGIPGLWNDAQQQSWVPIFEAVHRAGGRIAAQLFHTGGSGHSSVFGEIVAPSPIAIKTGEPRDVNFQPAAFETPRELATEEIPGIARDFAAAARRAIDAGADAVEIHAANSYLDFPAERPRLFFEFARRCTAVLRALQEHALDLWFLHLFSGPGKALLPIPGGLDQFVHHGHDLLFHRLSPTCGL